MMNGKITKTSISLILRVGHTHAIHHFYFFIQDFSLNITWILLILYRHVHNIHMEGTVSQIFYLGLSFIFILKNGKI